VLAALVSVLGLLALLSTFVQQPIPENRDIGLSF
jgi:hypothetical protein